MSAKKLWKAFPYGAELTRESALTLIMKAPIGYRYMGTRADGSRLIGKLTYDDKSIRFFFNQRTSYRLERG